MVPDLFQEIVHPLAKPDTLGAFHRGLCLMGIDRTVLNAPDTVANEKTFTDVLEQRKKTISP